MIQVGAPPGVASFLQRMGRTGEKRCDEELSLSCDRQRGASYLSRSDHVVARGHDRPGGAARAAGSPVRTAGHGPCAAVARHFTVGLGLWLGDIVHAVPEADRVAIVTHMLQTGVLADDSEILGSEL